MEPVSDTEARRLVAWSGPLWAVVVVLVWRWGMPAPALVSVAWVFACGVAWAAVVASLPEAWRP